MEQSTTELAIRLVDGRTISARPAPEDQGRLAELMAGGRSNLLIELSGLDTEGHLAAVDVAIDVEGHALTLRLPTPADAVALRRALAAGAITATIVAAGAVAALQGPASTPVEVAPPAAPAVAPAAAPAALTPASQAEQDRDLGIQQLDAAPAAAPAALTPASQAEQDRDLGITDLASRSATQSNVQAPTGTDLATQREQRLQEAESVPAGPGVGSPSDTSADRPDTRETRSGPLEVDR